MEDKEIVDIANSMYDWLVDVRRKLHAIPEPGNEELRTQAAICAILESLAISYEKKRSSIVALIEGTKHNAAGTKNSAVGPVVAIRADMDALPLQEALDRPYASTCKGYMHACGHDAHMAIALGAAKFFSAHRGIFSGAIKILFQPAEETTGGALPMIHDGCMENPHVDYVIGLHVMPGSPVGKVELKYGALNAASDVLDVVVRGASTHAAYPDKGIDAIMVAAKVLDGLHSIVSRNVSPLSEAVITIGTIEGGTRNNIVADEVRMKGTIRTTDPVVRAAIAARIKAVVEGVSAAYGGTGEANIQAGYAALINDNKIVALIGDVAASMLGKDAITWLEKPSLGVEDFSFFLHERSGAFYHIGCGNKDKGIIAPLHSQQFDIDERCLPVGLAMHIGIALALLNKSSL